MAGGGRAGETPGADASRDSGRVPLSSQKNAKGGDPGTQLATCVAQTSVPGPPTHFPASQEEASSLHPGGPCPESHRRCVLAGVRDEGKVVVGERRWRKLDDARGPLGAAASRGCCGGVRTLGDREDVGSVRMWAVWGRWGIVKHLRFLFLLEEAVQVLLGGHEFGVERGQVGKDIFGFFS